MNPLHTFAPAPLRTVVVLAFVAMLKAAAQDFPLAQAHAHNDYLHPRPLLDALDHGFCSVEADIFLVDGQLLVAHDRRHVEPRRSLQALYLEPLRQRVRDNRGRVFRGGPEFTLLIDLKTPWTNTYPVLRKVLTDYSDILTTCWEGVTRTNAVTVVLTGNRDRAMFVGENPRYAALDGDLSDLDCTEPTGLILLISSSWYRSFQWPGVGVIPAQELTRLRDFVARAHRHGRRIRFWGAPDKPAFWQVMRQAGVDLINTDDLAGLAQFLAAGSEKQRVAPEL